MSTSHIDAGRARAYQSITRWGDKLAEALQEGRESEARQFANWLFGAEMILAALGMPDLAQAAIDAERRAHGTLRGKLIDPAPPAGTAGAPQ